MSNQERRLNVFVDNELIADISLFNDQLKWHYHHQWQQTGYAVSPHLALDDEIPFINVQRFLNNLLPEGHLLDELTQYLQLSKSNIFALIRALGTDLSGH